MMETFLSPIGAAIAAFLSTYAVMRGQRSEEKRTKITNNTEQIQTIFDGYSRIVADLHSEVQRLHTLVDELHRETEICEERNVVLEKEITEVMGRLCILEERNNGK
jgi:archaellum component FlaC